MTVRLYPGGRFEKFGPLEPALYDKLQKLEPQDMVPVGIWVIGTPNHTQEQLFELLAVQYPEAREAMNKTG